MAILVGCNRPCLAKRAAFLSPKGLSGCNRGGQCAIARPLGFVRFQFDNLRDRKQKTRHLTTSRSLRVVYPVVRPTLTGHASWGFAAFHSKQRTKVLYVCRTLRAVLYGLGQAMQLRSDQKEMSRVSHNNARAFQALRGMPPSDLIRSRKCKN